MDVVLGVDALSGPEGQGPLKLPWVNVHTDDATGARGLAAHDHRQTHAAQAKHSARGARSDLGSGVRIVCVGWGWGRGRVDQHI
jgi:hypothetical protein